MKTGTHDNDDLDDSGVTRYTLHEICRCVHLLVYNIFIRIDFNILNQVVILVKD